MQRTAAVARKGLVASVLALAATTSAWASDALDGRQFHGQIYDEKGIVRAEDILSFRDGRFRSEKCREMGFEDSPYWTRVEGDAIHFLTESTNPAAGKIVLRGIVRGSQAEWKGLWSKERWYWSIRRDVSFRGSEKK